MITGACDVAERMQGGDPRPGGGGAGRRTILAGLLLIASAGSLAGQSDSVTVVAGARYHAGPTAQWLLGSDYRDLWTMPIRAPVLDLRSYAGGLTPTELGGGRQTISLRLMGADGREYAFRSVHKQPFLAADPDVAGALLGYLIQDQVSSMVPAAPLAAARLSESVGLMHAQPEFYVMPDDPALGEFRPVVGGMLGTLEVRPAGFEDDMPAFHGFPEIESTDDMLDEVEDDADHRIDSRTFLYARLLDLVIGDWDRHEDQWRWARRDTADLHVWVPIPRDRDYAFANYDGVALNLVRRAVPNAVRFEDDFDDLDGLLLNGQNLDRVVLADLERPTWDSVSVALQGRLTDRALGEALGRLPAEYRERRGEALLDRLRARRALLPEAAREFYGRIAEVPTLYMTDEDETATITRHPDGSVEVRVVQAGDGGGAEPYFTRTFTLPETREIRLFLRGGDDRAFVRGDAMRGMTVRVIGGGGDDVLADSSTVRVGGRWTSLHDDGDDDQLHATRGTIVDRREYEAPEDDTVEGLIRIPDPDFGGSRSLRPSLDYSTTRGVIVGGGIAFTRYAFRRHPFASRIALDVRYATRWSDFGLSGRGEFHPADPALSLTTAFEASRIDALRFYGFGNETTRLLPSEFYVVRRELISAEADVHYGVGGGATLSGGVIGKHTRPWLIAGSPLAVEAPTGSDGFGSLGFRAGLGLVTPEPEPSDLVYRLDVDASAYPVSSRPADPYGSLSGEGAVQLPLTSAGSTRLSARAGGRYAWGDFPFYEASFLGGRHSLRGLPEWRYAGDSMAFGGVEAMVPISRLPLLLNWRMAGFVFADAGRVFLRGEDSDRWHSAPGVGIALSALRYHVRLSFAHGPQGRVYLELGNPY